MQGEREGKGCCPDLFVCFVFGELTSPAPRGRMESGEAQSLGVFGIQGCEWVFIFSG